MESCTKTEASALLSGMRKKRSKVIPKSSYTVYIDEGIMLLRKMQYRSAKCCFNAALELKPDDPMALICRSQCNMNLGLFEEALKDAERCFEVDPHFIPGLLQFGEVLFGLGYFERALIYFHQGRRLRKKAPEFLAGVLKCEYAISCAILDRAATQIEDIDDIIPLIEEIENEDSFVKHQCCIRAIEQETLLENQKPLLPPKNKWRERWVTRYALRDMAYHKFFAETCLEKLSDKRKQFGTTSRIKDTMEEICLFLKSQERLFREMKPMYYRYKGINFNKTIVFQYQQEEMEHRKSNQSVIKEAAEGAVLKNLSQIEHALSIGRNSDSQLEAERSIRQIEKMTLKQMPRKFEFIMDMMHYRGIALFRQKKYEKSIDAFKKQIKLGQKFKNDQVISRALDFMGRANALLGQYNEAIEAWENRMDYARTPLEKAYTFHEIGRCNLELGKRELSKYYANESLRWAQEGENTLWTTFARVLLGQIELKGGNHQAAQECFFNAQETCARTVYSNSMGKMLAETVHCLQIIVEREKMNKKSEDDIDERRAEQNTTANVSDDDDASVVP